MRDQPEVGRPGRTDEKGWEQIAFLIRKCYSSFSAGAAATLFKEQLPDLCFVTAALAFSLDVTVAWGEERLTFIFKWLMQKQEKGKRFKELTEASKETSKLGLLWSSSHLPTSQDSFAERNFILPELSGGDRTFRFQGWETSSWGSSFGVKPPNLTKHSQAP